MTANWSLDILEAVALSPRERVAEGRVRAGLVSCLPFPALTRAPSALCPLPEGEGLGGFAARAYVLALQRLLDLLWEYMPTVPRRSTGTVRS